MACIGGVNIFSGRPDPTWNVTDDVVRRLDGIWNSLKKGAGERFRPPPLGYRGCFLKCEIGIVWSAYGGIVTLMTPNGSESRTDQNNDFEKTLLSSAPEGLLPKDIIPRFLNSRA